MTAAPSAPKITTQPADQSVQAGQSATFSRGRHGQRAADLPVAQERRGDLRGHGRQLYKTPVTEQRRQRRGVLGRGQQRGRAASPAAHATLTVTAAHSAPKITTQPADQSVQAGQSATFTRGRHRQRAADLPVAPERHGDFRGHRRQLHDPRHEQRRQRGDVLRRGQQRGRQHHERAAARLTVTAAPQRPEDHDAAGRPERAGRAERHVQRRGHRQRAARPTSGAGTARRFPGPPAPATRPRSRAAPTAGRRSRSWSATRSAASRARNGHADRDGAPSAPTITTQPANQSVQAGQSATFSVVATGSAPLTYQWRKNGTAIPGATGAQLHHPGHEQRRQRRRLLGRGQQRGRQRHERATPR